MSEWQVIARGWPQGKRASYRWPDWEDIDEIAADLRDAIHKLPARGIVEIGIRVVEPQDATGEEAT